MHTTITAIHGHPWSHNNAGSMQPSGVSTHPCLSQRTGRRQSLSTFNQRRPAVPAVLLVPRTITYIHPHILSHSTCTSLFVSPMLHHQRQNNAGVRTKSLAAWRWFRGPLRPPPRLSVPDRCHSSCVHTTTTITHYHMCLHSQTHDNTECDVRDRTDPNLSQCTGATRSTA